MRIEKRLCLGLSELDIVESAAVETEDGITIYSENELGTSMIKEYYSMLVAVLEERFKY